MLALAAVILISATFLQPAFAQRMRQSSSGSSLDVIVEQQWDQDQERRVQLEVSFLQPGTDTVQEHIDYDVKILDSNGNQVFSAAGQLNQPTLHTAEGVVTIPYTFEENGSYSIEVLMTGILFIPMTPETAEFSINVVPEFPYPVVLIISAVIGAVIAMSRTGLFSRFIVLATRRKLLDR